MKKLFFILFVSSYNICNCQTPTLYPERSYASATNFNESNIDRTIEMSSYNAAFNGIVGGVGSAMHKHSGEKTINAFFKGFYKGVASSLVMSTGKSMTSLIFSEQDYWYGWVAKITNSLGASMLENTIQNNGLFSNYGIDLIFMRVDINKKIQARLMPYHAGTFLYYTLTTKDVKLDWKQSLETGTLSYHETTSRYRMENSGFTYNNVVYVDYKQLNGFTESNYNIFNAYQCYAHETIHTYQDRNFTSLNYLWSKQKNKYFFWDTPFFEAAYMVGDILNPNGNHLANPFEYEAEYGSRTFRYGYSK